MCSDAPDTSGINAAAEQNAQIGADQLAFAKQQAAAAEKRQAAFDPKFQQILDAALTSQKTADDRSAQQWQQYLNIGVPANQRLADEAANYDTLGRRNEAAAQARAGIEDQASVARQEQNRALGRAGVSLTSGRALTLDNASRLAQTRAEAGAAQAARDKVEATGMSLTDNVAKLSQGISSSGLQAAQLALGAGSTAGNTLGQQQSTYNASLTPALQGYSGAVGANSSAGSLFGQVTSLQNQANSTSMSGLAGLGQLAGTLGSAWIMSSKTLKTRKGKVDGKKARRLLEDAPVERWKYKPGVADEDEHIGRYAEDIPGGPMGGKAIDVISELGLHHAAISDISKELKQVKGRLMLADSKSPQPARGRRSLSDTTNDELETA